MSKFQQKLPRINNNCCVQVMPAPVIPICAVSCSIPVPIVPISNTCIPPSQNQVLPYPVPSGGCGPCGNR